MGSGTRSARRIGMVVRWLAGMALTSWRYLWRTTPLHRSDARGMPDPAAPEPTLPPVLGEGLQRSQDGVGDCYHRLYSTRVQGPRRSADQVIDLLAHDPGRLAPLEVAVFWKTRGGVGDLQPGDEFVVRMPGPWDGPVRVVDRTATSFRLATLPGHIEAGQIEFRARDADGELEFEIESWTTSGDRLSSLLYGRFRLAKEMQLHMWTHYCEHVPDVAGGRLVGGVRIGTSRGRPD